MARAMHRRPAMISRSLLCSLMVSIEVEPGLELPPDSPLLEPLAEQLAPLGAPPVALQIDFDARRSQRAFYRALLDQVRARTAPGGFLSITALVSWTGKRSWLRGARR